VAGTVALKAALLALSAGLIIKRRLIALAGSSTYRAALLFDGAQV
jgi:hypothetical protein